MADEVEDWATAFLSIPLPTIDCLGCFSYNDNDDIDFEKIFAEIDAAIPNPKPEPADLIDYKGFEDYGDQEWSSFFPNPKPNPNPNPKLLVDVKEPVPSPRPAVITRSSGSGTSFDPVVIDDDHRTIEIRRQGCKRKRLSHWSTKEEFMGLLVDDYSEGNLNTTQMQLYEPMDKVARVN